MSQIFAFHPQVKTGTANLVEFEEMLEFEENICIYYRFYPYGCFIFLVLCFLLTSEPNYLSPDFFHGAALFAEHTEILNVENIKVGLPAGARI